MKRIHLHNLTDVRRVAVELARWAVDDGERKVGDPVHEWVTEGRRKQYEDALRRGASWAINMPAGYSSCGDLAHWLLMCLGCRDERVVNRGDDGGIKGWAVGANISRLVSSPWYRTDLDPQPGDILQVASPHHVAVLLERVSDDQWLTADYGQPYGKRRVCPVRRVRGGLQVRGRMLVGYVSLAKVPLTETALVPDWVQGEVDDNPYPEDLPVPVGV